MKITVFVEWTNRGEEKNRSLHKKGKKQRFRLQSQTETVRYVNTFMRMVSISIEVHRPSSMRKKKKSRKLKSAHGRRRELNDRDDRKKSLQLKWDLPIANMPIARTWIWRNKESYLASQFGQQHNQIMKLCIWLFLLLFWLVFLFFNFHYKCRWISVLLADCMVIVKTSDRGKPIETTPSLCANILIPLRKE